MGELTNLEFLDRQEITNLLFEYCAALDCMDLPRLSALFTTDCEVDYGPDPILQSRGAADLEKSLERMWRWSRTSHHLSNVQIKFCSENEAIGCSYVYAWHERPDGTIATILGQYHDRFIRGLAGWRIAKRRMVMNGCNADFTVNINRLERVTPPVDWVPPDMDAQT